MNKSIYIKSEFKKIFREPIMGLIFCAPLLFPIVFRLLIVFAVPIIEQHTAFNFTLYEHYVLSFVLQLSPILLSIIIGFSMIDDRDNKIFELISITPMSKSGYLAIRLSLVFVFVILYSVYSYLALGIYIISVYTLIYLSLLVCLYSAIMGLLLFSVATDKVNGLTYAKGLNTIALFAFVDLLDIKWLNVLGGFFTSYWTTQIIANPSNVFSLIMGTAVTSFWFIFFLSKSKHL